MSALCGFFLVCVPVYLFHFRLFSSISHTYKITHAVDWLSIILMAVAIIGLNCGCISCIFQSINWWFPDHWSRAHFKTNMLHFLCVFAVVYLGERNKTCIFFRSQWYALLHIKIGIMDHFKWFFCSSLVRPLQCTSSCLLHSFVFLVSR